MSSDAPRPPVVPLEAGIGPDNPPCPACGEPLFGWVPEGEVAAESIRRCERCGMAVAGEPGDAEAALRELDRFAAGSAPRIPNRASFAASMGGAGWAALEPGRRCYFTADAVDRLLEARGRTVQGRRWAPGHGVAAMWQTLLNGFTFGRNLALAAFGRAEPTPAAKPWQRRLDRLITVVVALPVLLVAVPLELGSAALGRGAVLSLRVGPR